MHCHNCGIQLKAGAKFCTKCGTKVLSAEVSKNVSVPQTVGIQTVSKKHKKLGIFFIILPVATLVATLLAWAVLIFVARTSPSAAGSAGDADLKQTVINILNLILGLVALVAVIGILVLVPLGIVFLNKKTILSDTGYDERSGKGDASIVPPEIHGWSWGAAGLGWIWGLSNSVWISLLSFVPILGYVWWIVLGIKGNEWAWKAGRWESVDQFKKTQQRWNRWGLAIFCLEALLIIASIIASASSSSTGTTY